MDQKLTARQQIEQSRGQEREQPPVQSFEKQLKAELYLSIVTSMFSKGSINTGMSNMVIATELTRACVVANKALEVFFQMEGTTPQYQVYVEQELRMANILLEKIWNIVINVPTFSEKYLKEIESLVEEWEKRSFFIKAQQTTSHGSLLHASDSP